MWKCVHKLAGLQDVMRVIAPRFPEYCERLITSGPLVSFTNPPVIENESSLSTFIWIFSVSNFALLLLFVCGFWFLCRQHRNLYVAIDEIPRIVQNLHARHNNYYAQLQEQNADDNFSDPIENSITTRNNNPFLAIECSPPQPIPLPPPNHQQIEMEIISDSSGYPTSSNPSTDSSPEIIPSAGTRTQYGRVVNPPDFFRP
ncbi:unnamed protein product [Orchesella dallaii]|uniref:Uncharacterized protein n=1 Tax=Orchesella dallaii TaxID=48710 RepID=A0ABP1RH78_9HEXA